MHRDGMKNVCKMAVFPIEHYFLHRDAIISVAIPGNFSSRRINYPLVRASFESLLLSSFKPLICLNIRLLIRLNIRRSSNKKDALWKEN